MLLESLISAQWCKTQNVFWLSHSDRWFQQMHEQDNQSGDPFSCGEKPKGLGPSVAQNSILYYECSEHFNGLLCFPAPSWQPIPTYYSPHCALTSVPQTTFSGPCCGNSNSPAAGWCHQHKGQLATWKSHSSTLHQDILWYGSHVQYWKQGHAQHFPLTTWIQMEGWQEGCKIFPLVGWAIYNSQTKYWALWIMTTDTLTMVTNWNCTTLTTLNFSLAENTLNLVPSVFQTFLFWRVLDFSEALKFSYSFLLSILGRFLPFMSLTFLTPLDLSFSWTSHPPSAGLPSYFFSLILLISPSFDFLLFHDILSLLDLDPSLFSLLFAELPALGSLYICIFSHLSFLLLYFFIAAPFLSSQKSLVHLPVSFPSCYSSLFTFSCPSSGSFSPCVWPSSTPNHFGVGHWESPFHQKTQNIDQDHLVTHHSHQYCLVSHPHNHRVSPQYPERYKK